MLETTQIWDMVKTMRHSQLKNYIAPGIYSHLVGGLDHIYGKVRVFSADRYTRDMITPHSHRFPFAALVLEGRVENTIYEPCSHENMGAEQWIRSTITQVCGGAGLMNFTHQRETNPSWYYRRSTTHNEGQVYVMQHHEIHSIIFEKDTKVLFFEGPSVQNWDWMLEPFVDGKLVPTFETKSWMFDRE